jgi:hypothetical protein
MTPAPQDPALAPWERLREDLAGYFAVRPRELLAPELALAGRDGEEFGRLRVPGPEGAELEAVDVRASIESAAPSRHRMLAGDAEVLVAETTGAADASEVRCGDRLYQVRLGLLRNVAVARSPGGAEAARVAGGLTNRSYEASFDAGNEGSLPVVVFVLYRLVALRQRAFLTGTPEGAKPGAPRGSTVPERPPRKEERCRKIRTTEGRRNRAKRREVRWVTIHPAARRAPRTSGGGPSSLT